jgi:hypothetical protein
MNNIAAFVLNKLKEPSTWHGINIIVAAVGYNVAPEMWQGVANTGVAVAGLIEVIRKEK